MVDYWHLLLYAHMKIINIRWQVTFEQRICILIKYLKSPINHTKTVRTANRSSGNKNNSEEQEVTSEADEVSTVQYIRKSVGNCWPISNNKLHTTTTGDVLRQHKSTMCRRDRVLGGWQRRAGVPIVVRDWFVWSALDLMLAALGAGQCSLSIVAFVPLPSHCWPVSCSVCCGVHLSFS